MDIVEQLNHYASQMRPSGLGGMGHALAPQKASMLVKAASEIDRLRTALKDIIKDVPWAEQIARRALDANQ
jgi:hypothetical protein